MEWFEALILGLVQGLTDPSLEQVVGYITPNSAKVMEINLQIPKGRFGYGRQDDLDE